MCLDKIKDVLVLLPEKVSTMAQGKAKADKKKTESTGSKKASKPSEPASPSAGSSGSIIDMMGGQIGGNVGLMANGLPCFGGYRLAVIVKTRLGGLPIPNMSVSVSNHGTLVTPAVVNGAGGDNEYCISPQPCYTDKELTLTVSYSNSGANLLKETVKMTIKDIIYQGFFTARLHKTENKIASIQNVSGTAYDKDYHEVLEDGAAVAPAGYHEEVSAGTTNRTINLSSATGNLAGRVRCVTKFTGEKWLMVDIYLATFSMVVPYINQNGSDECLFISGTSNTPNYVVQSRGAASCSGLAHDSSRVSGTGRVWMAKGHSLCYPTSVVMLVQSLGFSLSRTQFVVGLVKRDTRQTASKFVSNAHPWQREVVINAELNSAAIFNGAYTSTTGGDILESLKLGIPQTVTIGGHIILVIGAVINRKGKAIRYICHDPYGSLGHAQSNFAASNWYVSGRGRNSTAASDAKGKHVYYRTGTGGTKKRTGYLSLTCKMYVRKKQPFTQLQKIARLTPNA